jgi:hypothetical protein
LDDRYNGGTTAPCWVSDSTDARTAMVAGFLLVLMVRSPLKFRFGDLVATLSSESREYR